MPSFVRDGVRLAYREVGEGEVPVVLQTGGAGSGSMWEAGGYVSRLPGMRLVLFDHRGRGASDRPATVEAHRPEEYVLDLLALVDHLGVERFAFMGYSAGAFAGLVLAARDPRMQALVSLGCVFDPPGTQPAESVYEVDPGQGMAAVVRAIETSESLKLPPWAVAEFIDTDVEQFLMSVHGNAGQADPWEMLERIAVPSVLIAGSDEDPHGMQPVMAERMGNARSVVLRGCGHVGAFLRPDEVVAAALPVLRAA